MASLVLLVSVVPRRVRLAAALVRLVLLWLVVTQPTPVPVAEVAVELQQPMQPRVAAMVALSTLSVQALPLVLVA